MPYRIPAINAKTGELINIAKNAKGGQIIRCIMYALSTMLVHYECVILW